jgi:ABC-type molybdenum transport system ATPase subunit/photorepair protein PhrA
MNRTLPRPGELLALPENRARSLFGKWLRDESLSGRIAAASFAQHSAMAQQVGWLQARWHEDGELTVSQFLSYDSVWEVNPFEVGAMRPMTRKAFAQLRERTLRLLDLRRLSRRAFIALSNGEMRRVLLARALLKAPEILVLDDPAAGLDPVQRGKLKNVIIALCRGGMAVAMSYRHPDEVPGANPQMQRMAPLPAMRNGVAPSASRPVLEISGLTLSAGGRKLFDNFSWTVREGERWVLRGENGSGKSTLLSLVSGDNPFAYACDVKVFGKPRGKGVSLADVRRRIGMAGAEMQAYLGKPPMELLDEALLPGHDLLLLDEPFMNMSARDCALAKRKLSGYLRRHPNVAAILVSHRQDDIMPAFTFYISLQGGASCGREKNQSRPLDLE